MTRIIFIFISIFLIMSSSHSHEINKDNIDTIIKNFLKKNPDLLKSTLDNYKISLENEKKQNAIKLLKDVDNPGIFPKQADITIYEFFDYNCGYCKSVLPTLLNVVKKDKNTKLIFKEFPILSETSFEAALYALAAQKQNLYFEFHTRIMEYRGRLNNDIFIKVANDIGLDIEKLNNDLDDKNIRIAIEKNRLIAKDFNINGTPTLIIGDKIIPGAINEQKLNELIKEARDLNS